jgi:eukaryotic-like serine/threonine-protein kinase
MGNNFVRCPHCGRPHISTQIVCPATGKSLATAEATRSSGSYVSAESLMTPIVPRTAFPARTASVEVPPPPPPPPPPSAARSRMKSVAELRDLAGKKIGEKYVVRSVLGEGGMGTVYEAEHLAIGRLVAVKVLHPAQARKRVAVRRFHQEARAAGAIGHPNICEVYDLGTLDDGSPYLVMEKLVGETLADRIGSEGGLPFDEVIDILTQVLSGLVAAHEKGIVHRDIKPENIFLTRRVGCPPVAKILDFGVSKMVGPALSVPLNENGEEEMDLTRPGMVMGTPFYMSPEQARGDRNLDARVDLYACGIILYEALTGRRPFLANNYNQLLMLILSASPKPVREIRPGLPIQFDRVVDKAMSRKREDRYQSAAEFQLDLQALRDRHAKAAAIVAAVPKQEPARQGFTRPRPPAPPARSTALSTGSVPTSRRLREIVPLPGTPSSVEIPVDYVDDRDTEKQRISLAEINGAGPRESGLYDDTDAAETEVRFDAGELLRKARSPSFDAFDAYDGSDEETKIKTGEIEDATEVTVGTGQHAAHRPRKR